MSININKRFILAKISLLIPVLLMIGMLDSTVKFIPLIRVPTEIYCYPIYICPFGLLLAILSGKNKLSYMGFILNCVLIVLQILFLVSGCKFLLH